MLSWKVKSWGLADLSTQWVGWPLHMAAQRSSKQKQRCHTSTWLKPRTDTALPVPHSTSLCQVTYQLGSKGEEVIGFYILMGEVGCTNVDGHCWSNPTTIVSVLLNPGLSSEEGANGQFWDGRDGDSP